MLHRNLVKKTLIKSVKELCGRMVSVNLGGNIYNIKVIHYFEIIFLINNHEINKNGSHT